MLAEFWTSHLTSTGQTSYGLSQYVRYTGFIFYHFPEHDICHRYATWYVFMYNTIALLWEQQKNRPVLLHTCINDYFNWYESAPVGNLDRGHCSPFQKHFLSTMYIGVTYSNTTNNKQTVIYINGKWPSRPIRYVRRCVNAKKPFTS
jgi:hypothetical protein